MQQEYLSSGYLVLFSLHLLFTWVHGNPAYDFIIIGAGTAGGAIARRLVESGRFKVLLVEAGGVPKPNYDVPAFAPRFLSDMETTFRYRSIPQKNAALQTNGIVSTLSGRMLGGTSSLNFYWFNRGHPRDWDNWANMTGDDSWKYSNMLQHFKRAETYRGDFPSDQHGYDGPISVSRPSFAPGLDYFLEAGRELGYPVADPNGPQQRSFTPVEFAKRNGRRIGSYAGYLTPILDHPNLTLLMNTNVTKIIFEGNRAVGVQFTSNSSHASGMRNVAYASKEIIVSAGPYNSPLLLQRSGIGPREILRAANIPVIKDLPVGQNFQDHPRMSLHFAINNRSAIVNEEEELTEEAWEHFNNFGDGPYSNTRGATGQVLMSTSVAKSEGNYDWPDMQLCMSHSALPYVGARLDPAAMATLREGEVPISMAIFMGRPKSCGSVNINPKDVYGHAIIDMGYLDDPRDLEMFLDGISETLRIFEQSRAYRRLKTRYIPFTLPPCEKYPVKSRQYWICFLKQTLTGGAHGTGTNKMGRRSDPSSVVDSELRVIGIEGMRVADASIMPYIVNANPHAAVYGIAEKAAYMILKSWESSSTLTKLPPPEVHSRNPSSHPFWPRDYYRGPPRISKPSRYNV